VSELALPWQAPEGRWLRDREDVTAYLFLEDAPGPADAVLVFGGTDRRRALPAADLFRRGLVRRVVLSGGPPKRPTGFATEAEAMAALLREAGVPPEAMALETRATNTLENVRLSLPWLPTRGTVILVTKPVHMRRAAMTARRSLPGARLLCVPGPTADCARDNWWSRPEWRRTVARELAAIARYHARGDIAPLPER
jgi:uncharacterized SAM-binding protein YcdF (DUF218 family)